MSQKPELTVYRSVRNRLTTGHIKNKGVTEIWKDPTVFKICKTEKGLPVWFLDFIEMLKIMT